MIFVGLATLSLVGCFAASAMLSQQQNAAAAPAKLTSPQMMAQFHGLLKTQTGQMLAAVGKSFTANYEKATPAVKRLVDEAMSELAPLVKGRYTANFDALHHTSAPAPANRKVEETEADGVERMEKMEKMVAEFWVKRFAATSSSSPPAAAALLIAQLRDALGVLAAIDGCVGKWVETTKKPSSPRGVVKHAAPTLFADLADGVLRALGEHLDATLRYRADQYARGPPAQQKFLDEITGDDFAVYGRIYGRLIAALPQQQQQQSASLEFVDNELTMLFFKMFSKLMSLPEDMQAFMKQQSPTADQKSSPRSVSFYYYTNSTQGAGHHGSCSTGVCAVNIVRLSTAPTVTATATSPAAIESV